MEKDNSFAMISIVAIVAVVGLIVLIMGGSQKASIPAIVNSEDLIGQVGGSPLIMKGNVGCSCSYNPGNRWGYSYSQWQYNCQYSFNCNYADTCEEAGGY